MVGGGGLKIYKYVCLVVYGDDVIDELPLDVEDVSLGEHGLEPRVLYSGMIQGDLLYMAVRFWYLVTVYTSVH